MDRRTLFISTAAAASFQALGGRADFETACAQTKADDAAISPGSQISADMGAPVTSAKAPNGAIANKKLLDRLEEVVWIKPTIEGLARGMWQFGGYGLAPIAISHL